MHGDILPCMVRICPYMAIYGFNMAGRIFSGFLCVLLPQEGDLVIPLNLRVYHVESGPIFFGMALSNGGRCASYQLRVLDNPIFCLKIIGHSSRHDEVESLISIMHS